MSIGAVLRGGVWVYISTVYTSIVGYLYWMLISRIVEPSVVGAAATLIGSITILGTLLLVGIPTGLLKFLGMSTKQPEEFKSYFSSSLIFSFSLSLTIGIILLMIRVVGLPVKGFDASAIVFLFLLLAVGYGTYSLMFNSLFNSLLKTKYSALSSIAGGTARLIIGFGLVYIGMGLNGIMTGYLIASLVSLVLSIFYTHKILNCFPAKFSYPKFKIVLHAGSASWVPDLIAQSSQWLGVLGLYAFVGSSQSGRFFITMSIASVVFSLSLSFLGLMFPVLSGMTDGRKAAVSRSLKLVYAVTVPIVYVIIAYPKVALGFIGPDYVSGASALIVLTAAALLLPLIAGFTNLVYAYGNYKYVLALGLATNVTRVVLYIPLSITMGELGAALSYTLGLIPTLILVAHFSRKIKYYIDYRSILLATIAPTPLVILSPFLSWPLGVVFVTIGSTILYARLGLVKREELAEIARSVISRRYLDKIYPHTDFILKILYGS